VTRLRLGVDVGGTHTDAVIVGEERLVAKAKVPTTPDVRDGIGEAVGSVLTSSEIDPTAVGWAMLGTTYATNAILERRSLRRVAVVRLGAPLTHALPPLATWPRELRDVVSAGVSIISGGFEYDGQELAPFDDDALARFLAGIDPPPEGIAVTSVFSPASAHHELLAAQVIHRELGDVHVSLSHEIGPLGLIERENATVLNAALVPAAEEISTAFGAALTDQGLSPEAFFAQNDGTLMALDHALSFPVLTIGSGPANSMRGAAHLSGVTDAIVVDVGGTSTDIGVLVNGFPRETTLATSIAGVDTNFRMPDLRNLPLGGGSVIDFEEGRPRIGPHSVGFRLTDEALVFGGSTPTLSDAAVAAGRGELGRVPVDASRLPGLSAALARADALVAEGIDAVKAGPGEVPVIAVGGGSFLLSDEIPGASSILRPLHHEVANAVGAATALVSGQSERICSSRPDRRRRALDDARAEACERAVHAGADPRSVEVVEVDEIPLTYLVDPAIRVRVKAAGPLA
jgi:N-methylhydantoinase A/oxoprolinase/acetone carboxylase beta subunit